jgi:pimeloyl-ACP methyl ester carboxylesterase
VDSVGFDHWPTVVRRTGRAFAPFARFLPPAFMTRLLRADVVRGYDDPERANRSIDLYLRPFDGPMGRDAVAAHLKGSSATSVAALSPRLATIATPTAIVWGEQDRTIPLSVGRCLHDAIPGSTLDIIPERLLRRRPDRP